MPEAWRGRSASAASATPFSTPDALVVLALRDRFEVGHFDAEAHVAEMVDVQSFGDRAMSQAVSDSMNQVDAQLAGTQTDAAVASTVAGAGPEQAVPVTDGPGSKALGETSAGLTHRPFDGLASALSLVVGSAETKTVNGSGAVGDGTGGAHMESVQDGSDEFKDWDATGGMEHKAVQISGFKSLNDHPAGEGVVECLVSVTGLVDRVKDIIEPGAYEKTLAVRTPKGVWSHQWDQPISKTLQIEELLPGDARLPTELKDGSPWPAGAGALLVTTQFNIAGARGKQAYEDVKFFGDEQEWSIGYNVPPGAAKVESKTGIRRINYLDLFEYSPVLFGAMPEVMTRDVKTAQTAYRGLMDVIEEKRTIGTGGPGALTPPNSVGQPVGPPPPAPTPTPRGGHAPGAGVNKPAAPSGSGSASSLHPHNPAGSPTGGQFAKKGSSGSGTTHAHKGKGRHGKTKVHSHSHKGAHTHPVTKGPGGTVTVTKGMTLWALAGKLLGDPTRWREIAALNGIKNPRQLPVGAVLKIPGSTAKAPVKAPAAKKVPAGKVPKVATMTPNGVLHGNPIVSSTTGNPVAGHKALPVFDEEDGNGPIWDQESMAHPAEELNEDQLDTEDGDDDAAEDEKEDVAEVNDDDASSLLDTMKDDPEVELDARTGAYDDVDETEFEGAKWLADETEIKAFVLDGLDLEVKRGNAETLRRYWAEGEGAAKIRWGEGGDFDRCVAEVDKYMPGRAKGYCNLLHHRALGFYPATHAAMLGKSLADATLEEFGVKTAYLPCPKKCGATGTEPDGTCSGCGAKKAPMFTKACPTCESETKTIGAFEVCPEHGQLAQVWELKDVTTASGPAGTSLGFGKVSGLTGGTVNLMPREFCPKDGKKLDGDGMCPVHGDSYAKKAAPIDMETRRKLADEGIAMPDGSFPIANKDHLDSAVGLFRSGHTGADKGKTKAHIEKRASAIGADLPDDWHSKAMPADDDSAGADAQDYRYCPLCGAPLDGAGYCANDQYQAKLDSVPLRDPADLDDVLGGPDPDEAKSAAIMLRELADTLESGAEPQTKTLEALISRLEDVVDSEPLDTGVKTSEGDVDLTVDVMAALAFKAHLDYDTKSVAKSEEMPPFPGEVAGEEKWSASQLRDFRGRWAGHGDVMPRLTEALGNALTGAPHKPVAEHTPGPVLRPAKTPTQVARDFRAARGIALAGARERARGGVIPGVQHSVLLATMAPVPGGRSFESDYRAARDHAASMDLAALRGEVTHQVAADAHENARTLALNAGKTRRAAAHEAAADEHRAGRHPVEKGVNPRLDHAIATALQHIPIKKQITKPEYWDGFTIIKGRDGLYQVHDDRAMNPPTETPMLPWHKPEGTPVAHVDINGKVTHLKH